MFLEAFSLLKWGRRDSNTRSRETRDLQSWAGQFSPSILGLANPEEALAKAQLAWEIAKIIKKRKLTQKRVATILKIAQPKVSLLLRGYLKSFSMERLFRFLNDLGQISTSKSHLPPIMVMAPL